MANPRDVEFDIVGHDKSEKATRSAADNLDKLARKANDVDDANKNLGARSKGHFRKLSNALRGAADKLDRLKRKTEDGALAVRSLGSPAAGHLRKMSRAVDDTADEVGRLKRKVDEVDRANQTMGQRAGGYYRRMADGAAKAARDVRTVWTLGTIPLIIAAIAALPAAATVAGIGIVLGLGGGLSALGIKFAAENEKVAKSFSKLKDHVVKKMAEISAAFVPVLIGISGDIREAFDGLAPELKAAFDRIAPIVKEFSKKLFGSLDELGPALDPIVDGFETLAEELGKGMPGLMESIAQAFTDISDAIGDNPTAIADVIAGLGEIIETAGKVIAWLIRMNATIDASESGFDSMMYGATAAFAKIAAKAADMAADVLEALARIPGPGQAAFRLLATAARTNANIMQRGLDGINTKKAQADIRSAEARLRVLGNMKPTPEVKAEIEDLKRKIREAKALLARLDGTTATTYVVTRRRTPPRGSGSTLGGDTSAGGVGFALTAPGSGTYRTGGPATPDVYATTYVQLDGREIAAHVKTIISEATGRQSFRARSGRR